MIVWASIINQNYTMQVFFVTNILNFCLFFINIYRHMLPFSRQYLEPVSYPVGRLQHRGGDGKGKTDHLSSLMFQNSCSNIWSSPHFVQNLVKEFITDEFKTAVQSVLDQALQGEETANFEFPLARFMLLIFVVDGHVCCWRHLCLSVCLSLLDD